MEIIWWLIVGGLAGWVAGLIMKGRGFGVIGNIIVGIVGAIVGGLIFGALGIGASGFWGTFWVALVGAVVLLFLVGLFKRTETV